MNDLRIEVKSDRLPEFGPELARDLRRVVSTAAYSVERHAKRLIQTGPKTGRIYDRNEHEVSFGTKSGKTVKFTAYKGKKRRKPHQASAPGEAPATDTGNLANSIQTTVRVSGEISAEVSVGAGYGAALEDGPASGKKLAARPYMRPAVDAVEPSFVAAVDKLIERELNR